jgi:hypothetical protein
MSESKESVTQECADVLRQSMILKHLPANIFAKVRGMGFSLFQNSHCTGDTYAHYYIMFSVLRSWRTPSWRCASRTMSSSLQVKKTVRFGSHRLLHVLRKIYNPGEKTGGLYLVENGEFSVEVPEPYNQV